MKALVLSVKSPIRRPSLRRGFLLFPLLLVYFGLAPMARAAGPDTDGVIAGSNNGEGIPTATPIDGSGIARRYPGDKNIASDLAVIFADDFESYTSPSQLTNNWDAAYHLPNIRIATEPHNVFSGHKSLEFSLPINANEVSNSANKIINPTQDTVFIRAYTKFDPGYHVTGSNHNGLVLSAQFPGPGRPPPPDGTGWFLFLLQNNIMDTPRIGESTPGFTHLYSYWPRQRSEFGDHWYPDGYVVPFDNGIGEDGEQIGIRGDWLAFPSQYPDFNPMANFLPQRDRWYCYELMVRANTPGQNNGVVKVWIDGTVVGDFPNLFVRSITTLKIDEAHIGLHAQHSERLNKKWYDNVVIATQYIGPMVSPTPTPTPVTGPPIVTTNPATLIASFSARLNGSLNPHGLTTTFHFRYGPTTGYGLTTPPQSRSGNTSQNVSANISNLMANRVYHFRIVASNAAGTRFGVDRTFTTRNPTGLPIVITNAATNVASHSATLNGLLYPHGLSTSVNFQYGPTTSYGSTTPTQTRIGNTYQNVSANISGLVANRVYHFRIKATNMAGTRFGNDRTFTTRP
jgi:hypothetical protein